MIECERRSRPVKHGGDKTIDRKTEVVRLIPQIFLEEEC
jgi:hypothetical protein